MFPRVSLRNAHPKIQRGEEYEVAYSQRLGSRTYAVAAYHELVRNAALVTLSPGATGWSGRIRSRPALPWRAR